MAIRLRWRVEVEGGEETPVLDKAGASTFAVTRDGICFFDWKDVLHPVMQFYSSSSRRSTVLYEFPPGTKLDTSSTAISVSSDGRWILHTQMDQGIPEIDNQEREATRGSRLAQAWPDLAR